MMCNLPTGTKPRMDSKRGHSGDYDNEAQRFVSGRSEKRGSGRSGERGTHPPAPPRGHQSFLSCRPGYHSGGRAFRPEVGPAITRCIVAIPRRVRRRRKKISRGLRRSVLRLGIGNPSGAPMTMATTTGPIKVTTGRLLHIEILAQHKTAIRCPSMWVARLAAIAVAGDLIDARFNCFARQRPPLVSDCRRRCPHAGIDRLFQ